MNIKHHHLNILKLPTMHKLSLIVFLLSQLLIHSFAYQTTIEPFQSFARFFEDNGYINITAYTDLPTTMMILDDYQCDRLAVDINNMTIVINNNIAACVQVTECELISVDDFVSCFVVQNDNDQLVHLKYFISGESYQASEDFVLIIFILSVIVICCGFYSYRLNNNNYYRCPELNCNCSCPKINWCYYRNQYKQWKGEKEKVNLLNKTNQDFEHQYSNDL